jgi:hypothetical protein
MEARSRAHLGLRAGLTLAAAAALLAGLIATSAPPPAGGASSGAEVAKKKCKKGKGAGAAKKKCKKKKKQTLPPSSISISPPSADFGSVLVTGTSTPRTFTVTNTGPTTIGSFAIAFQGPDAGQFVVTDNFCNISRPPGTTCPFDVRYRPNVVGMRQTATVVVTGSPGGTASATVSGIGEPL